jgi:hypothetical protein
MIRTKILMFCGLCVASGGYANAEMRPTLAFSGVTGLIDMPSGDQQSDGVLSVAKSQFGPVAENVRQFPLFFGQRLV